MNLNYEPVDVVIPLFWESKDYTWIVTEFTNRGWYYTGYKVEREKKLLHFRLLTPIGIPDHHPQE
jgi:hypothetical protein